MEKLVFNRILVTLLIIGIFSVSSSIPVNAVAMNRNSEIYIDANSSTMLPTSDEYMDYEEYIELRAKIDNVINEHYFNVMKMYKSSDDCSLMTIEKYDSTINQKLEELGCKILSRDEKMEYMTMLSDTENGDVALMGSGVNYEDIEYPSIWGIDMIAVPVTYKEEEFVEIVIYQSQTESGSRLLEHTEATEMYSDTTVWTLLEKVIRVVFEGVATGGLKVWQGLIVNSIASIAEPSVPTTNSSLDLSLDVKPVAISSISHFWRKTNDRFYFRLATNSVAVSESWRFMDGFGNFYYSENDYIIDSPNYRNIDIALTQTDSTSFSVSPIKYQSVGILGIYVTRVKLTPYHAATPLALAFDN